VPLPAMDLLSQLELPWQPDITASYLITGGLGGIASSLVTELLASDIKHIVLCSRHTMTVYQQESVDKLQKEFNAVIEHHVLDIANEQALKKLMDSLDNLHGIFHLAGNNLNAAFGDYTMSEIENSIKPKLAAWHLHELTKEQPIKYFVLFSSMASFLGSNRQAPYVIANGCLDALAQQRKAQGLPITHIQWGPWKEIGMANLEAQSQESLGFNIQEKTTASQSDFVERYYATDTSHRYALLESVIITQVNEVLGLKQLDDKTKGFFELGMDSLMAIALYKKLTDLIGNKIELRPMFIFDYPTLEKLSVYLYDTLEGLTHPTYRKNQHYEHESIAIIGVSGVFPGGARDIDSFWENMLSNKEVIRHAEKQRWDNEKYPYKAGFVDDIDLFDANFFNICAREAQMLDPQQRLLLETTWHALEHSGIEASGLNETETGVFIGISQSDYAQLLIDQEDHSNFYQITGNALNVAAGRIAFILGLQGPTMAIDTACSSSLVALHEACRSLENHECTLAIAGGVNVLLNPKTFEILTQGNMLSIDSYCKTFDKDANGYVRGEGCGVVILKRLSDAISAQDTIYAVIKGSAINQDGASSGLTVPNGLAQEKVMTKALAHAGIEGNSVDYIEAHGTGTHLGDPIEMRAIQTIYGHNRHNNPLVISTVKTHIGHLESAAGIAGLIKTILMLQHEIIPAHLHFNELNPAIHLDEIPAKIPVQAMEWKRGERVRRAGISSFGFSGTNAHVILEEAPVQNEITIRVALPKTVFNRQHYWVTPRVIDTVDLYFLQSLKSAPFEQRAALLKQTMLQEIKKVLGESQVLDENTGFFDMGMDSIMALELKNRLETLLATSFSNTLAFDYPNVATLHEHLCLRLNIQSQIIIEKSTKSADIDDTTEQDFVEQIDKMTKQQLLEKFKHLNVDDDHSEKEYASRG